MYRRPRSLFPALLCAVTACLGGTDGALAQLPLLPATSTGTIDGPRDLVARDLVVDGDVDLLSAGQDGDRIAWWENREGNASVWTEHEIEAALDGAPDAAAVGDRDSLYWFRNPGDTSTWPREEVSVGVFDADGLTVQEADGTGAPDLVVASSFDSKIVIFENHAAQARLTASDVSVAQLPIGTPSAVLELEASSVLAALRFHEDLDGSGDFDPGPDLLIAELLSPSPTAGSLTFTLPDFVNTIGTVSPRTYFLVVETTPDAPAQATDTLRITLRTSRSRMEDTTYDTPLALQSPQDVSTQILLIEDPNLIFSDGFESGDTSGWSVVVM